MDLTASSTSWIWAFKSSSSKSNSQSERLSQHDNMGNLNFNLQVAKGGNSLNPFVASAQETGTGTGTASVSSPTANAASGNIGGSVEDQGFDQGMVTRARIAHGTIMGLAFALFFPLGGIIIRVLSFRGLIWVHAGLQMLTYTLALAGMGLGVYISLKPDNQVCRVLFTSVYPPSFIVLTSSFVSN